MSAVKASLLVMFVIAACFPATSLAGDHDHKEKAEAEHAHHMKPKEHHGLHLSSDLKSLLNQEMNLIQQGMRDLIPAISAGEWDEVAAIGQKIKASFILKQKLTAAQKEELHEVLPEQFIEMDMDFHKSAGMLAHAAEMKNADVVSFYFYKMNAACVSCHGKYAAGRFPGLAKGKDEEHHH